MKVLLIKPNNLADHIQPSLGHGYLATQIRANHDVVIHDCIKDNTSIEQINKIVARHNPDIIGIQCYTFDTPKVYRMFETIKKAFPDKITVVGGAHISSIPIEFFNQFQPYVDYAFNSEAEIGFSKFLAALERGDKTFPGIEGLIWRKNGQMVSNLPAFVQDLDKLGFPAWDLMSPASYVSVGMTRSELLALKRQAFLSFHFNPKIFLTNLLAIKSFRHFKFFLRRFYHWILMRPAATTA